MSLEEGETPGAPESCCPEGGVVLSDENQSLGQVGRSGSSVPPSFLPPALGKLSWGQEGTSREALLSTSFSLSSSVHQSYKAPCSSKSSLPHLTNEENEAQRGP